MGYLAKPAADIPLWIQVMIEDSEIDFATFEHADIKTNKELVEHFDTILAGAAKALEGATEEDLQKKFLLKANGQVTFSIPVTGYIDPTLNHWVYHRGQLTVYMRLNEIAVPSILGPSADDKQFASPS